MVCTGLYWSGVYVGLVLGDRLALWALQQEDVRRRMRAGGRPPRRADPPPGRWAEPRQIAEEAERFRVATGIATAAVYGGAPRGEQLAAIRGRPEVLVATPGRLVDFLLEDQSAISLQDVRLLVLDEADRTPRPGGFCRNGGACAIPWGPRRAAHGVGGGASAELPFARPRRHCHCVQPLGALNGKAQVRRRGVAEARAPVPSVAPRVRNSSLPADAPFAHHCLHGQ